MASTTEIEQQKRALVERIAESRNAVHGAKLLLDEQIACKKASIKETLDVPKRIQLAFREKPAKSFGIALASGLGASIFLKKKSKAKLAKQTKTHPSAPKKTLLVSMGIAIIRPVLQKLALQYSQQWLSQRAENKFAEAQRLRDR